MNAKCIYANLQHFNLLNSANISEAYSITIQILNNPNIYIFNDQLLQISYEYVKISLEAMGHFDVYFGPFVINKFSFEAFFWIHNFTDINTALHNYSTFFTQIIKEKKEVEGINFKEWYNQQVEKIVNKSSSITDLINIMNNSPYNPYV